MSMIPTRHTPQTSDGWRLDARCYVDPDRYEPSKPPVLFIPGYGMNSYILAYHPRGVSMVEHLVRRGFEVWTVNLRGQGDAEPPSQRARRDIGFRQLALTDVPCALELVRAHTRAQDPRPVLVGCSLGGTIVYAYLAHHPDDHGALGAITLGAPLRWDTTHPLLKLAARSPALIGAIPIKGIRPLAARALPIVARAPVLLAIYMNAAEIDLSRPLELVPTVDDPTRWLNRQIARWVQQRDLFVNGVNISEALAKVNGLPLMCLIANRDGVVTPQAALSVLECYGDHRVSVRVVGDDTRWYAHADMFIGNSAHELVFDPMARWIEALPDA